MHECCADLRQSFARFPPWVQPLITAISGKAGSSTECKLITTPMGAIAVDLAKLAAGVTAGIVLVALGGFGLLLLPLAWIITVNGIRSLTSDSHYAGHSCVTANPQFDRIIGDTISLIILTASMRDYAGPHNKKHHGISGITTIEDSDLALMQMMRFETGQSKGWYGRRLARALVSPRYHCEYFWHRFRSNLLSLPLLRLIAAWIWHGGLFATAIWYGVFHVYLVAWIIPLIPLVAISAALQFPSEHLWLAPRKNSESNRELVWRVSHGRFFLRAAPKPGGPRFYQIIAWMRWAIMMVQPILERSFVCVSILPSHDYHHRRPTSLDWPMEPYLRAAAIERGDRNYREFWGLGAAYNATFDVWAMLPQTSSLGTSNIS